MALSLSGVLIEQLERWRPDVLDSFRGLVATGGVELLAETYYGAAVRDDLETRTHTLQYGTGLPNGSFFLSASAYRQDPIYSRDRSVSSNADTRTRDGTDKRSSATPDARLALPDGTTLIATRDGYRPAGPVTRTSHTSLLPFSAFVENLGPMNLNTALRAQLS